MGSFKVKMHQNRFRPGYDAPPDLLVSWGGGHSLPIPPRRLRRLDLVSGSGWSESCQPYN